MIKIEIERLGPDGESCRIYEEEDWRVCLTYAFEFGKGDVSRSVTGEERSIAFKCG